MSEVVRKGGSSETVERWCTICVAYVACDPARKVGFDRHLQTHPKYRAEDDADTGPTPAGCAGGCEWICGTCGATRRYRSRGLVHGGPSERLADRRYGLAYCADAKYPDHKRYLGTIDGKAGPVVWYHVGAPNPEQPVQDDPSLKVFLDEKSVRKSANPRRSREGGKKVEPKVRRRATQGGVLERRDG